MTVKNNVRTSTFASTVDADVTLETASSRLLDIVKGSDGGFGRMTMDDARCIAHIIKKRIAEN